MNKQQYPTTTLQKEFMKEKELSDVLFAGIQARNIYIGMRFVSVDGKTYTVRNVNVREIPDPSVNWTPAPTIKRVYITVDHGWWYAEDVKEWLPNTLGDGMRVVTRSGEKGIIITIQPNRACHVEVNSKMRSFREEDLRAVNVYNELLESFCSKDELRPALTRPHQIDDNVYAADGRKMIVIPIALVPGDYSYSEEIYQHPPDFLKALADRGEAEESRREQYETGINGVEGEERVLDILVKRDVYATCPICDGEKQVRGERGKWVKCKECKGNGHTGEKTGVEMEGKIYIGKVLFAAEMVDVLYQVAKATRQPITGHKTKRPIESGVFKCGELTMLMMGVDQHFIEPAEVLYTLEGLIKGIYDE